MNAVLLFFKKHVIKPSANSQDISGIHHLRNLKKTQKFLKNTTNIQKKTPIFSKDLQKHQVSINNQAIFYQQHPFSTKSKLKTTFQKDIHPSFRRETSPPRPAKLQRGHPAQHLAARQSDPGEVFCVFLKVSVWFCWCFLVAFWDLSSYVVFFGGIGFLGGKQKLYKVVVHFLLQVHPIAPNGAMCFPELRWTTATTQTDPKKTDPIPLGLPHIVVLPTALPGSAGPPRSGLCTGTNP